ncbi:hypothetical protein QZH44_30020 (plasmid) [Pseudomonas corrugata]|uniref:hypothetical protein n=1 Tax=Pseudomonas corrugata TaxID=47879 RepID=UPI003D819046
MGLSIRFCVGVLVIVFAAFSATLIGSAAAMGEIEAIAKFAGVSGFLKVNWRELMCFGPVGCVLLACLGGAMVISGLGLQSPLADMDFPELKERQ